MTQVFYALRAPHNHRVFKFSFNFGTDIRSSFTSKPNLTLEFLLEYNKHICF